MSIGLLGAHRVGKSTLASQVSMETGMPLLLTTTSDVVKRLGVDLSQPMSFIDRMTLQVEILKEAESVWRQADGYFITDRTPLDMLAYTLADIGPHAAPTEDDWDILENYTTRCYAALNANFSTIILIQPGIVIREGGDKATAPLNKAYIEHMNTLLMGLMYDYRCNPNRFFMPRKVTHLDERAAAVIGCIKKMEAQLFSNSESVVYH